jgi:hypothetical protein
MSIFVSLIALSLISSNLKKAGLSLPNAARSWALAIAEEQIKDEKQGEILRLAQ